MATATELKETNILKSVILATVGALFLSLMALSAKLATEHSTLAIIVFFRFAVTGFYILAMLGIKQLSILVKIS